MEYPWRKVQEVQFKMNGLPTVQVFLMIFWEDNNSLQKICMIFFDQVAKDVKNM